MPSSRRYVTSSSKPLGNIRRESLSGGNLKPTLTFRDQFYRQYFYCSMQKRQTG
jgi:hypothetical protein